MSVSEERCVCKTCGRVFSGGERFCAYDGSDLQPERPTGSDPLIGTVLAGSYTILEKLGSGGMGVVYRAWQNRLERNVAIKVLSPKLGGDGAAEERFRTEALAVSRLTNPHTVAVHDFGSTEDGLLYLVMKLAPGESLRTRLARGPIGLRTAVTIAAQICESLTEAHDRHPQIVHRDIKPDNILVHRDGDGVDFVTVLDFGLAKLANTDGVTQSGLIVGTPKYMAPEQAQDERTIDARVDIYSLGVVLYEMVTGRVPFDGVTTTALLYKHVWEAPQEMRVVRPDLPIPAELERVVQEVLSKRADDRPASAHLVRARLLEIQRKLPDDPDPLEVSEPASPRAESNDEPATESSPAVVHPLDVAGVPASEFSATQEADPSAFGSELRDSNDSAEAAPLASTILPQVLRTSRWTRRSIALAAGVGAVLAVGLTVYGLSGNEPSLAPPSSVADTAPTPKAPAPAIATTTPVRPSESTQTVTASIAPERTAPRTVVSAPVRTPKPRPVAVATPERVHRVAKPPAARDVRAESREEERTRPVDGPEATTPKRAPEPRPQHHPTDDFPVVPE